MDIDIQILEEKKWETLDVAGLVNLATDLVFQNLALDKACEISFLFTNNAKIQELNKQYRGKDKPTNVLSFAFNDSGEECFMLGDVCLAYDFIKNEALEQNKKFQDHLLHLIIHGILHLVGFDHIDDNQAEEMEELETELLSKINITNPYKGED